MYLTNVNGSLRDIAQTIRLDHRSENINFISFHLLKVPIWDNLFEDLGYISVDSYGKGSHFDDLWGIFE